MLTQQSRQRKGPQQDVLRVRIVIRCAAGETNLAGAGSLGISNWTVGKWRARFVKYRFAGLRDEPRIGGPQSVSDRPVIAIVNKTLNERAKGATHWSTRRLAKESGVSRDTVKRIWHAFGLLPHRLNPSSWPRKDVH